MGRLCPGTRVLSATGRLTPPPILPSLEKPHVTLVAQGILGGPIDQAGAGYREPGGGDTAGLIFLRGWFFFFFLISAPLHRR